MGRQLLISLVEAIQRFKERSRIGGMKHDGNIEFPGLVKHRIKPLVIDAYQLATSISERQAQVLPYLETHRAALDQPLQVIDRLLNEAGLIKSRPIHPANRAEASRRGICEPPHNPKGLIA